MTLWWEMRSIMIRHTSIHLTSKCTHTGKHMHTNRYANARHTESKYRHACIRRTWTMANMQMQAHARTHLHWFKYQVICENPKNNYSAFITSCLYTIKVDISKVVLNCVCSTDAVIPTIHLWRNKCNKGKVKERKGRNLISTFDPHQIIWEI